MMKRLVIYLIFSKKVDYNNRRISHSAYEVISSSVLAGIIARKYKINVNIVNKKWQMSTNLVVCCCIVKSRWDSNPCTFCKWKFNYSWACSLSPIVWKVLG